MPGSVELSTPTTVMPFSLSSVFVHSRSYVNLINKYRNGETQRALLTASSRKFWKLSKKLTESELSDLKDFYIARNGGHEPFYFYDPYETSPKFTYDPTGVETVGRHIVHFSVAGAFTQSSLWGARHTVEIELEELA